MSAQPLHAFLRRGSSGREDRVAVLEPGGPSVTYGELTALVGGLRDRLAALGVGPGDRVGICIKKSIDSVASVYGILESGAAYVPLDPGAPASRNAYILNDCSVRVAIVEQRFEAALRTELDALGGCPPLIVVAGAGGGAGLRTALEAEPAASAVAPAESAPGDLAYILYTSGSTGRPKGVKITHENATSFVNWCMRTFEPTPEDRFSSHAPFHFDLSILDLYTSLGSGASLVLIGEGPGKEPVGLAKTIAETGITVWYSAPSILALLAQFGRMEEHDYSNLRLVLFAGEVFPVVHLRSLVEALPRPRYFNLYGPTETNVCTFYEVREQIPADRVDPYPIGMVCDHLQGIVVDTDGREVAQGAEGELCIAGPSVTQGYWNLDEVTAGAFLERDGGWYRTGDIVVEHTNGDLQYVGRRDRMVKRRGYRVELGEIEACLYRHPEVVEAAVIAIHEEQGVRVSAHLSTKDGERLSGIKMKSFCSEHLPLYMVPDEFRYHASLPRTSTDKVDYQRIASL